jgi:lactoylglutathione lyase
VLKLPGDEFVTIELVFDPKGEGRRGDNLSHLVVQVESLDDARAALKTRGVQLDDEAPQPPNGADEVRTSWLTDPDGNRIELVQWPAGHAEGMSAADFPDEAGDA